MTYMQTGKTDENKWEQGAVWGSRVKNMCCLFPACTVPQQEQEHTAPLQLFFSNFRASVIDKSFIEGF